MRFQATRGFPLSFRRSSPLRFFPPQLSLFYVKILPPRLGRFVRQRVFLRSYRSSGHLFPFRRKDRRPARVFGFDAGDFGRSPACLLLGAAVFFLRVYLPPLPQGTFFRHCQTTPFPREGRVSPPPSKAPLCVSPNVVRDFCGLLFFFFSRFYFPFFPPPPLSNSQKHLCGSFVFFLPGLYHSFFPLGPLRTPSGLWWRPPAKRRGIIEPFSLRLPLALSALFFRLPCSYLPPPLSCAA